MSILYNARSARGNLRIITFVVPVMLTVVTVQKIENFPAGKNLFVALVQIMSIVIIFHY